MRSYNQTKVITKVVCSAVPGHPVIRSQLNGRKPIKRVLNRKQKGACVKGRKSNFYSSKESPT